MIVAAISGLWAILSVVVYVLLALLVVAVGIGSPGVFGFLVYQRAQQEGLDNPAAVGFAAGFFALLIGLFLVGTVLVYVG